MSDFFTPEYGRPGGLVQRYGPGNIDLFNRPVARNPDGSISTVRSMTVDEDGRAVLLPTVVGGKVVSPKEAIEHYRTSGEQLGRFENAAAADKYAEDLHQQQAKMYQQSPITEEIMRMMWR